MKLHISVLVAALLVLMPWAAQGQSDGKAESEIKTTKIVLHPMAEPRPALKYKLLPAFIDLKPGNAALFYDRLTAESSALFNDNKMWDKALDWVDAPLTELPDEKVRAEIVSWKGKINGIMRASQCEYCDWQVPIREDGYFTLLPDLQQTRSYARLLTPYARLQIIEGKYDDAIQTLQAGYALGRNVANGPTFVHNLIGCAIVGVMSDQVRDLIQQPAAPNLYWALSDLPRPIIDFRPGTVAEYDALYTNFPELKYLETKEIAPDQWQVILQQTMSKTQRIGGGKRIPPAVTALLLIESYPRAKAFLIERGWAADKVEAMPVSQVVLIAGIRQYAEINDDLSKWMYLPYSEAYAGMRKANAKMKELFRNGQEIIPLASLLLPAMSTAKAAEARGERNIAILRIFEAIRLYAAAHDGRLPDKLSDITDVPVPIDPLHGTAFIYNRIDETAILEAPGLPGLNPESYWLRYEIHIESKGK
jgi:hypothetical protein